MILFKYESKVDSLNQKNIQYEVYNPETNQKLDLSVCENNINLYIPVTLKEESKQLLNEVTEQEYDILDLNSNFYKDVCTPFTSEKNTDILLNDRINYYYYKIAREATCPLNCKFDLYISENNYLKCKCEINNEDINTEISSSLNKYLGYDFKFLDDYKFTSYKTMKCYNLVFDSETFGKNAGSILVLLFFIGHLTLMGLYFLKGLSPLKTHISQIINENNNSNFLNIQNMKIEKTENDEEEKNVGNKTNPPKKGERDIKNNKNSNNNNDIRIIKYKPKKDEIEIHSIKSGDIEKPEPNFETENVINIDSKNDLKKDESEKSKDINLKDTYHFDDYEINKLKFQDAIVLDKRNYLSTYLSTLKREQLIMLIIFSRNDYNLFFVKINRLIFLLCTEMTLNALLFADETIHKFYIEDNKYNFGQSFPHIIYSLLITHVVEILLCYLSMTDIHIYQIKSLKKNEQTPDKIYEVLKLIKIKLIAFYIFTGLVFIFYWYCVSAFCAVYQKTQGYFILNAFLSFIFELIDPFIIYALLTLLRRLSLKYHDKKGMNCLYKIIKFFPIF